MKDYSKEIEAKENSSESVETGASINIINKVLPRALIPTASRQLDSEGMNVEE